MRPQTSLWRRQRVRLLGVPIGVKDLEVTNGLRTALGCTAFADWVPDLRLRGGWSDYAPQTQ